MIEGRGWDNNRLQRLRLSQPGTDESASVYHARRGSEQNGRACKFGRNKCSGMQHKTFGFCQPCQRLLAGGLRLDEMDCGISKNCVCHACKITDVGTTVNNHFRSEATPLQCYQGILDSIETVQRARSGYSVGRPSQKCLND